MLRDPCAEVLASGLGAALTDTMFNPLEIIKVRRQLSGSRSETIPVAASAIWRHGGIQLLWTPGLQATWLRSFGVTGLRVGLYPSVRNSIGGDSTEAVGRKAAAGMMTGAISAAVANPIDMVRTRIHAQVAGPTRYASTLAAATSIVSSEGGVTALWRGLSATVSRQILLSGGQLASYDQVWNGMPSIECVVWPLRVDICALTNSALPLYYRLNRLLNSEATRRIQHFTSLAVCSIATLGPLRGRLDWIVTIPARHI